MAKDAAKLKNEMRGEVNKLKDEMKSFQETMKREFRNDLRQLKCEQKETKVLRTPMMKLPT